MNRYNSLMKRVRDGQCILIDGATCTEVEYVDQCLDILQNEWAAILASMHILELR